MSPTSKPTLDELVRLPTFNKKECRAFLKSLAASEWQYHIDDPVKDVFEGWTPQQQSMMQAAVDCCFALLGPDEAWEVYGAACGL